ncbi:MAG: hypothetical protein WD894_13890 [Pirellulales bacterium]
MHRGELWFIRDAVRAAATALQVRAHDYQTFEEFEQISQSMGNEVLLTQPRVIRVEDPYRDVERLFQELVEVESEAAT